MKYIGKGEIVIGGKLPARLIDEFLGELNATGAKIAAKTPEQIRQALDENGHLVLVADKAKDLEAFCVTHNIQFDRHGPGGNARFRPGMQHPESPDTGGEALLDADNIRPVAKEVAKLVTVKLTRENLLAATVQVIRHLNSLLPPEIKPLPPLEIEE
jgi:hypothetical protein